MRRIDHSSLKVIPGIGVIGVTSIVFSPSGAAITSA
jgi:hypothetical protein